MYTERSTGKTCRMQNLCLTNRGMSGTIKYWISSITNFAVYMHFTDMMQGGSIWFEKVE